MCFEIETTIKGGLSVVAALTVEPSDPIYGKAYISEIQLFWLKKNGCAGKSLPRKILDAVTNDDWDRIEAEANHAH